MLLTEYMNQVEPTDELPADDLQPILLGLFGEVGSIMATAKKLHREKEAYAGYRRAVEEEFGDALWYLTALCRRLNLRVDEVLADATQGNNYATVIAASDFLDGPISRVATPVGSMELDAALLQLGEATAALFILGKSHENARSKLAIFADCYIRALKIAGVTFGEAVRKNVAKTGLRAQSNTCRWKARKSDARRICNHFAGVAIRERI
jgi:NTP pyrophosphatase (non-canonical NTP hydrolase)